MLTARMKKTHDFLCHYDQQSGGESPTLDEICLALKLTSKSHAHRLLTALEQRGKIRRLKYRARAIEIIEKPVHKETYFLFNDETKELDPWAPNP